MIPGAPAAWYELHSRFGKLPFESLFEPAVDYAENGFAVMPVLARLLQSEYKSMLPTRTVLNFPVSSIRSSLTGPPKKAAS